MREKLELHRSDPNCAACHRKIDPLGLAFDNYDAIGRWRNVETVRDGIGDDPKLDPSGELYDGRKFADAAGLKRLLLDDTDKFAAAFTEKLATYALRRGMTFSDRGRAETHRRAGQSERLPARVADRVPRDERDFPQTLVDCRGIPASFRTERTINGYFNRMLDLS